MQIGKIEFIVRRVKNIDRWDVIIAVSIAIKMITIFMTVLVVTMTSTITRADIEATATALEVNPTAAMLLNMRNIGAIGNVLLIPAAMFAFYCVAKKLLKQDSTIFRFFVYMVFYSTVFNFMNDFAVVIAMAYRGGLL